MLQTLAKGPFYENYQLPDGQVHYAQQSPQGPTQILPQELFGDLD